MKRMKFFARMLCMLLCCSLVLTSCGGNNETPNGEDEQGNVCTVTVLGAGGMALENVGVYVYTDKTMSELVWFERTDAEGKMSFEDEGGGNCVAVLQNVPSGYEVAEYYVLTGAETVITLSASSESMEDDTELTRSLGELMCEFTVTDTEGNTYTLAGLLAEKSAVVLNFWYLECDPCRREFPYLQAAYEQYGDDVAVLAINPVNADEEAIRAFRTENGYTFPMAAGSGWAELFGLTSYPTTVVVDRNGVIAMMHTGAVVEAGVFEAVFAYYAAEDYTTQVMDLAQVVEAMQQESGDGENGGEEESAVPGSDPAEPLTFGGVTQFEVTVPAGGTVYADVYKVSGMVGSIKSNSVTVTYNGKVYQPVSGTVSFSIPTSNDPSIPASLAIQNTGNEDSTFTVNFYAPSGTLGNPVTLSLGDFTASLSAGNSQGVYYTYTATEDGVLTLKKVSCTSGVECDMVLYNLNSYAYRTLQEDGEGESTVSISVKKGDKVQIVVSVLPDSSNNYPAATIKGTVSFSNGEPVESEPVVTMVDYTITVKDTEGNAVRGVSFSITVDGAKQTVTTNAAGKATITLPAGSYNLTMTVPIGYTAQQTAFVLTEASPNLTAVLTLQTQEEEGKDDENGGEDEKQDDPVDDGIEDYVGEGVYYEGHGYLYPFQEGVKRVQLNSGGMTYFTFEPETAGTYQFRAVGEGVEIGYYGTPFFIFSFNAADNVVDNTFTLDVQGGTIVIGINAAEDVTQCVLEITYQSKIITTEKLIYDDADCEPGEYGLAPGKVLTQVDVSKVKTSDLVLGEDGFYYLDGKLVLVDLEWNSLSLADLVYKTGFVAYFDTNSDGKTDYIEEYNASMREYVDYVNGNSETGAAAHLYVDSTGTGRSVYPLNAELMYMIQNGGSHFGWWDADSANYLSWFSSKNYAYEDGWLAFLVTAE